MNISLKTPILLDPFFKSLLRGYLESGLSTSSDLKAFDTKATAFIQQLDQKTRNNSAYLQLREFTLDDFEFEPSLPEDARYEFVLGFEGFYIAVIRLLSGKSSQTEYKGFSRIDSPPLEVYNFVGHNKLDIKINSIKYSLLHK